MESYDISIVIYNVVVGYDDFLDGNKYFDIKRRVYELFKKDVGWNFEGDVGNEEQRQEEVLLKISYIEIFVDIFDFGIVNIGVVKMRNEVQYGQYRDQMVIDLFLSQFGVFVNVWFFLFCVLIFFLFLE